MLIFDIPESTIQVYLRVILVFSSENGISELKFSRSFYYYKTFCESAVHNAWNYIPHSYYITTNELPDELSREDMISSHHSTPSLTPTHGD